MTEGTKNNVENGGGGSQNQVADKWERMAREAAAEEAKKTLENKNSAVMKQEDIEALEKVANDPNELSDDDIAYQKKLMQMAERPDREQARGVELGFAEAEKFDPLSDAEIAKNEDSLDQLFESDSDYTTMQLAIREAANKIEKMPGESTADYTKRLKDAIFKANAKYLSDHKEELLGEKLNSSFLEGLKTAYPRQEGENTADWVKRIADESGIQIGVSKRAEIGVDEDPKGNLPSTELAPQDKPSFVEQALAKEEEADIEVPEGLVSRRKVRPISEVLSNTIENAAVEGETEDEAEATEDNSESEEAETSKSEHIRDMFKSDLLKTWCESKGVTPDQIDEMSDEDIELMYRVFGTQLEDFAREKLGWGSRDLKRAAGINYSMEDLIKQFNEDLAKDMPSGSNENPSEVSETENNSGSATENIEKDVEPTVEDDESAESEEDAEAMEKLRQKMIHELGSVDLNEMLKAENVKLDDLDKLDMEGLKDLHERLRGRMMHNFGAEGLADLLKRDDLKMDDLEKLSFEEMRDLREKYRKEFMHDLNGADFADKLKAEKIKVADLDQMTLEQLVALKKRLSEQEKPEDKVENKAEKDTDDETNKMPESLVAVINNRERDAKIAARALAEEMFQNKIEGNGKRLGKAWRNLIFGQMLKESTMMKYEREALDAIKAGEKDVRGVDVSSVWSYDGDGAGGKLVERLTLAYTNGIEDSLIHGAAGNEMSTFGVEVGADGKKVVYKYSEGGKKKEAVDANSAEAKSTIAIRNAVERFAKGKMDERSFKEAVKRAKADMVKEGVDDGLTSDTLLETAIAAKQRFDHEESIENVMAGFRLINADYQAQVRTEVHRSKIDEISEKISGKLGIVQPETVAAAAGIAVFFTQKGATSALRASVPIIGGALAAGTFAAFKEHNRVAVDRAEQMRRIARGEEIGNTKYDAAMEETSYNSIAASELTKSISDAIKGGDAKAIQMALAQAEQMTTVSDERGIDLINFSAGDNATIEDERLALDVQIAQAKVELKKKGITDSSKSYREASRKVLETIEADIDAKDEAFRKLQNKRVVAQFAKTAAIGVGTAVVGQEVTAAFNPNSYGLFDKLNDTFNIRFKPFNIGVNNPDAHNTMLAGALGFTQTEFVDASAATGAKLTDEEVQRLRNEGYTVKDRKVTSYEKHTYTEKYSASEYASKNGVEVSRDWGSNGTSYSDGNELGLWRAEDGHLYTHMSGDSFSNISTQNFDNVSGTGQVKMLLSLTKDSQGTPIEIPGTIGADGQISFISNDAAINDIIKNGKYAFAEVAYDTGKVTDGAKDMFIFATHVGENSVTDFSREVTENIPITETVYDVLGFERNASRLIDSGVVLPFASRKNLTHGKKGQGHKPSGPVTFNPGNKPTPPTPPTPPQKPTNTISDRKPEPTPPSGPESTPPSGGPDGGSPISEQQPESTMPETNGTTGGTTEQEQPSTARTVETTPATEEQNNSASKGFEDVRDLGEIYGGLNVTRVELTNEEIDALIDGMLFDPSNPSAKESYRSELKKYIDIWNSASEADRIAYMTGNGQIGTPLMSASMALQNNGTLYIGSVDDVAKTREKARNIIAAKQAQAERERAKLEASRSNFATISGPNDLRAIDVSDERIRELNSGIEISDDEMRRIREAMEDWNYEDNATRKDMISGNFEVWTNPAMQENDMRLLAKYHIIAEQPWMLGDSVSGQVVNFRPRANTDAAQFVEFPQNSEQRKAA